MEQGLSVTPEHLRALIAEFERPQRRAFTTRFPLFKNIVIAGRCALRNAQHLLNRSLARTRVAELFPFVIARHKAVLRRKLGTSDPRLQERKIVNLQHAIKRIDGLIVQPGETFSFWNAIGKPRYKDGYVDGMLLSNGIVSEGLGGGLCQLSNFLFWILLHTPSKVVERHHHSVDVFPDEGRVLPFGSGATVFYNYIDLQMKNVFDHPTQIHLWMTDTHLEGEIRSSSPCPTKYHVVETNHCFIRSATTWYRYNELYREVLNDGKKKSVELISKNCSPVMYPVTERYLVERGYQSVRI